MSLIILFRGLHYFDLGFKLTLQPNKVGHFIDHVDVAPLEGAGDKADSGRCRFILAILATEQAVLPLLHRIYRRIDQLDALEILRQVGGSLPDGH